MKKLFAVFTTIVTALAVVGVAWASGDDDTSTRVTAATQTSADVSADVSTSLQALPDSSTSTSASASTSTSAGATTSTSTDSSTSTTADDRDARKVPDGVTTHVIPGVGTVTIEVKAGQLILVDVTAPGWNVERQRVEKDRIRLELTTLVEAEARFEARINDDRVEVRIKVDSD